MKSVCFGGEAPESAQRWFRADFPASCLKQFGWDTSSAMFTLAAETEELRESAPRLHCWDGDFAVEPWTADVVTLRLMDDVDITDKGEMIRRNSMPDDIARARADGQVVVYDLDDDVWNIPAWSPAAKARNAWDPRVRAIEPEVLDANIRASNGVMTSTEHIAGIVRARHPDVPVWVMRPGIDPALFEWPHERFPGRLRIGWMAGGFKMYRPHLETIRPVLDEVCLDTGAEFIHIGRPRTEGHRHGTQEWKDWAGSDWDGYYGDLPMRAGFIDWGPFKELPPKLQAVDVAVIPRMPDDFHEGQSVTSGIEYAAAGVPFVAKATKEYRRLAELGIGLVADSPDEWRAQLRLLLTDDELREELRRHGRKVVEEEFGPQVTGRRYHELLSSLV